MYSFKTGHGYGGGEGRIPRTSKEGNIRPVGIGSMGSRGLHTSHGMPEGDEHQTFLAGWQLYIEYSVSKYQPTGFRVTTIERLLALPPRSRRQLTGVENHTGALREPNGALDRLGNSHPGQNSWRRSKWLGGWMVELFFPSRGDVPALRYRSCDIPRDCLSASGLARQCHFTRVLRRRVSSLSLSLSLSLLSRYRNVTGCG